MVLAGIGLLASKGLFDAVAEAQKGKPRAFYISGKPNSPAYIPLPSYPQSARPALQPTQDLMPYVVAGALFGAL